MKLNVTLLINDALSDSIKNIDDIIFWTEILVFYNFINKMKNIIKIITKSRTIN